VSNVISPNAKQQFFDNNGKPAVGYKLFTYVAGTSIKADTYADSTLSTINANPIILDYRGEANIWLEQNSPYKYVFANPNDTDPPTAPIWSVDQIRGSELLTLYGGVDLGSVNAYVLTFPANFTSYADGIIIYWIPGSTNTAPSTLNVNGLGALAVVNSDGSPLVAGSIILGQMTGVILQSGEWTLLTSAQASGTQTLTLTGVSGGPVTASCRYNVSGRNAYVVLPGTLTGTSNSTSCTLTGLPSSMTPAAGQRMAYPDSAFLNNSVTVSNISAVVSPAFPGTIQFLIGGNATGFTAANTKGVSETVCLSWTLA
jgi:hypothetical protein